MKRHSFIVCLILFIQFLAGCTAVPAEPAVESAAATSSSATAVSTPTAVLPTTIPIVEANPTIPAPTPIPTETSLPAVPLPVREQVDQLTAVAADAIAYVQNDSLFMRNLPDGEPLTIETCPEGSYCIIRYLKWSPDGEQLLYYIYERNDSGSQQSLRLVDRQGTIQIISEGVDFFRPAAWSPDGRSIVFMNPSDMYTEATETQPGGRVMEVWIVPLSEAGIVGPTEAAGTWQQFGDGCGGGGRSASEVLYENEGGTAYGYLMGVLEWTAQDILLYTKDCTNIGMGRFDLTTQTELPDFDQPLRNLVLNSARDRWFATNGYAWSTEPGNNQLLTGTPDSAEITVIPTSAAVELVFVGAVSGDLYYTERTQLERKELSDRGLYFAYFQSALWRIHPDGSGEERLLLDEDAHAYAQVSETAVGDILLVQVENEEALYEAGKDTTLSEEALQPYFPQRHIMQLPATGGEPVLILTNAGQPTVALRSIFNPS